MNRRLQLAVRNAACTDCRMSGDADQEDVCITGGGPNDARVMVVTKGPLSPRSRLRAEMEQYLDKAGIDPATVMWTSAVKCRTWNREPSKGDQKACAPYLREEFRHVNPEFVLTLGAEAWFAASGWADVTKHRGKLYDVIEGDGVIFPTISPSAVARNPGLRGSFEADLMYFGRLVRGEDNTVPYHTNDGARTRVMDKDGLRSALRAIQRSAVASYDIETTGASEHDEGAAVVSIAITVTRDPHDMATAHTYEIPLFHPESPFRAKWLIVLAWIVRALTRVPRRVAHNAKFDTKWMQHFTETDDRLFQNDFRPTFDTIIAASLLDENRSKGLKPLAQMLLGAEPWGIDTRGLLDTPLDDVLTYNGLDTWHTLRLYFVLRAELIKNPRTGRLFKELMMPAIQELVPVERRGVYVDQDMMRTNWNEVKAKLEDIHSDLRVFVPPSNPFEVYVKKTGELKHDGVNWNPSNFLRWFLFDHRELPVLARGKIKDDGSPGDPSTAEDIMMVLAETDDAAKLLLDRVAWNKFDTSFFAPWSEQIDSNSRIHSVFKPWGTVTGRLSSGKEDTEKVTGQKNYRGVNLQQVPRNKLLRGVFGAAPDHIFIEADYSQVELRVAAFLARERTMLHLYATGQDIHMAMAMRMTGKPEHLVTKEERKRAKAVNFGFLYGMGWRKFVQTAWSNYGLRVTEEEAKAFRTAFFDQFPGLMPWHAKQRRLAHTFGRVESPMGRVRHLPDIHSPDQGVSAEAERQAINSPVQAFASDMALMSLVLTGRQFRAEGLRAWPIGAVHDAVNYECHRDDVARVVPLIKATMEDLPLGDKFGIFLDVPIVADVKLGKHWGSATEVPNSIASDAVLLDAWVDQNRELILS